MAFLQAENIRAGYGQRTVIENLSFSLEKGQLLGLLGENGCGKTTLLKALCGNLPHEGRVLLEGAALEGLSPRLLARQCSYIPQRSGITIDISALEVVAMGFNPRLRLLQQPNKEQWEQARQALAQVGLAGREEENYQALSEGQKQLCILARTLVSQAKLLLLDEPESALDLLHRYRTVEQLRTCCQGGCGVLALHDPQLALNGCHRVLLLQEGRCLGILSPQTDPLSAMEQALGQLYGPVTLARLPDKKGNKHLVMVKDREENP